MTGVAAMRPTSADLRALPAAHQPDATAPDVLDDLGEATLRAGGEAGGAARMASKARAAAVSRH
jgi:hypothetical protein